jgi:hypothetical protein
MSKKRKREQHGEEEVGEEAHEEVVIKGVTLTAIDERIAMLEKELDEMSDDSASDNVSEAEQTIER